MEKFSRCRKCGRVMKKEYVGEWKAKLICPCGFSDFELISGKTRTLAPPQLKKNIQSSMTYKSDLGYVLTMDKANREKVEILSLEEISMLVSSDCDFNTVLNNLLEKICASLAADVSSIYILEGNKLVLRATRGLKKELVGTLKLEIGEGITGTAAKEKKTIIVEDISLDKRSKKIKGVNEDSIKAMLAYPILHEDFVLGVINMKTSTRRIFEEDEITFISIVSNILSIALRIRGLKAENHLLFEMLGER